MGFEKPCAATNTSYWPHRKLLVKVLSPCTKHTVRADTPGLKPTNVWKIHCGWNTAIDNDYSLSTVLLFVSIHLAIFISSLLQIRLIESKRTCSKVFYQGGRAPVPSLIHLSTLLACGHVLPGILHQKCQMPHEKRCTVPSLRSHCHWRV